MTHPNDVILLEAAIKAALEALGIVGIDTPYRQLYSAVINARHALSALGGKPREYTDQDSFPCISFSGQDILDMLEESEYVLIREGSEIEAAEAVALDLEFEYWRSNALDLLEVKGWIKRREYDEENEDDR